MKIFLSRDEWRAIADQGRTLLEIGDQFGCSRERIRQLFVKFGLTQRHREARARNDAASARQCTARRIERLIAKCPREIQQLISDARARGYRIECIPSTHGRPTIHFNGWPVRRHVLMRVYRPSGIRHKGYFHTTLRDPKAFHVVEFAGKPKAARVFYVGALKHHAAYWRADSLPTEEHWPRLPMRSA